MSWVFRDEAQVLECLSQRFAFPRRYLVLDVETTGFSKTNDFIIDAGWAVVNDNKIVHHESLLLDWSRLPGINHGFIKNQLLRQADEYAKKGRPHHYPWERLCDEGEHPLEVLHAYAQLIYDHIMHGHSMIIGHALWRFDREMIDNHTQQFFNGYLLPWQMHSIMDTGLLEKAAQTGRPPYESETLDDWLRRVDHAYSKVKWNLESHCVPKYNLVERYGVDMQMMHTAGFDCILIHYLMDTFRQLTEILNGQRQVLESTAGGRD